MSTTKTITGVCGHCQGSIQFTAAVIGQTVACPHCGQPTDFHLPTAPEEPLIPRRLVVFTIISACILLLGMLGLYLALHYGEEQQATKAQQRLPGVTNSASSRR